MVEPTSRLLVVAVFGGECGGSQPGQLDLKEHHLDVNASATLLAVARGISLQHAPLGWSLLDWSILWSSLFQTNCLVWSQTYQLSTGSVGLGAPSGHKRQRRHRPALSLKFCKFPLSIHPHWLRILLPWIHICLCAQFVFSISIPGIVSRHFLDVFLYSWSTIWT